MMLLLLVPSAVHAQNDASDWVFLHNDERSKFGVEPVTWDDNLAAVAQAYAHELAPSCSLIHSSNGYGENLFQSGGTTETARVAMDWWILKEKVHFDFENRMCHDIDLCGHFSQVVWRASTAIGCGRAVCDNGGGAIFVCNYSPAGNVEGEPAF